MNGIRARQGGPALQRFFWSSCATRIENARHPTPRRLARNIAERMNEPSAVLRRFLELLQITLGADATLSLCTRMRARRTREFHSVYATIERGTDVNRVIACVEVCDEGRPDDAPWVDAMRAKHQQLDTTVLLLVAHAGFSPLARQIAEHHGIAAISLQDLAEPTVGSLLGPEGSLWPRILSVAIDRVEARVAANALLEPETVDVGPTRMLHARGGASLYEARYCIERLLKSSPEVERLRTTARAGMQRLDLTWSLPEDEDGRPLFLKKLLPRSPRRIESIAIETRCHVRLGRFATHRSLVDVVRVTWPRHGAAGSDEPRDGPAVAPQEPQISIWLPGPIARFRPGA